MSLETIQESLQPIWGGGSFKDIGRLLYYSLLLRYVTQDHLKNCFKTAYKYATKNKLNLLVEFNYLQIVNESPLIFTATRKTYDLLLKLGENFQLLPKVPEGKGVEIYNTDVFIQALKLPNFRALLFPNFQYIIPDALLVLAEDNRYQLNFLEIEAEKPYWNDHLQRKRENYIKLATDERVYNYWVNKARHLDLPSLSEKDFKFQVVVVGEIEMDFGEGWVWQKSL